MSRAKVVFSDLVSTFKISSELVKSAYAGIIYHKEHLLKLLQQNFVLKQNKTFYI